MDAKMWRSFQERVAFFLWFVGFRTLSQQQRLCEVMEMNVLIFKQPLRTKWDGTLPLCVRHAYIWYLLKAYDLESMLDTFIDV